MLNTISFILRKIFVSARTLAKLGGQLISNIICDIEQFDSFADL